MVEIAQLVKLLDYISRYQSNPFHYPSQYIRLKQENWQKLNIAWENENEHDLEYGFKTDGNENKKKMGWNPFRKDSDQDEPEQAARTLPKTSKQLKQYFLNQLFPLQLKWATSTITHESFTDVNYMSSDTLRFFLQRFPDIYLMMYYPIFNIKNAPIDGEIIMIGPFGIEVISLINNNPQAMIIATDDRTWTIEEGDTQHTIISPVIALKRTEQIIKSILQSKNIEFPISKTILSQTNHIMYSAAPYKTNLIGKRDYDKWFEAKRGLNSSLKSVQLKAMETLLDHCQTTSVRRPEWEKEDDTNIMADKEDN